MRNWTGSEQGRWMDRPSISAPVHAHAAGTHNPYKPAVIDWPELGPEALSARTSFRSGTCGPDGGPRVDPRQDVCRNRRRPAVARGAGARRPEEARHKVVLSHWWTPMASSWPPSRIRSAGNTPGRGSSPASSECINCFFAFGLFERRGAPAISRPNWSKPSSR